MTSARTFLVLICFAWATPALAQTVVNPQLAVFQQSDPEFNKSLSYHMDFFACTSLAAGVCQGQAVAPFQVGSDIAKAAVTTISPPNPDGTNRSFSMTTAPITGVLASMPTGTAFVTTLAAVGDPNMGATNSARSAASNPFFPSGTALAPVGTLKVR